MARRLAFLCLLVGVLVVVSGCGRTKLIPIPPASVITTPGPVRPPLELDDFREGAVEPGGKLYTFAVQYDEGAEYRYELTNDMVNHLPNPTTGKIVAVRSDLTAIQTARVEQLDGDGAEILTSTFEVESHVEGDEEVAAIIAAELAGIEGSRMVGRYDALGWGTGVYMERGKGLSPIGAQAGGEDLIVGLMGMLLPPTPVALADEWLGPFDFSAQVAKVFASVLLTVENGDFPIVYSFVGVSEEKNYAVIGIYSEGRPAITMQLTGGAEVTSDMHVVMRGRALIDLDSGWLREMKVTTTVEYGGFMPGVKQSVLSIARRISK